MNPSRTKRGSTSRMECNGLGRPWGHTRTLAKPSTRSEGRPSLTTPSPCLALWQRNPRPPCLLDLRVMARLKLRRVWPAPPSFLLHRSFKSFYHTFHQCRPHHLLRERPLAVKVLRMARYSPSDGHQGAHAYYLAAALRPIEIDHSERVPSAVSHVNANYWDYCGMPASRRRRRSATASVGTGHQSWPS